MNKGLEDSTLESIKHGWLPDTTILSIQDEFAKIYCSIDQPFIFFRNLKTLVVFYLTSELISLW